ncbi:hypothetical protein O53_597 [Microcystis aeruginosa TAIHU98]|uniref:Uncharacterized protein n=1 Tax=Microcystis aeruginosa TAIHU98 TaxID=1134457 RepID=L7EBF0_MICAE|nr:hypothetical protein O53_597 [Microcystis aeruginosa TAIHU98]
MLLTASFCELDSKIEGGTILFPRFFLMLFLPSNNRGEMKPLYQKSR